MSSSENVSRHALGVVSNTAWLFAISGIFHYKRSKGWLQGQRTISTRSSFNSRIIDGSAPNYDQLDHIFRGFLYSARWLPEPIATAREPLIYQHILGLFAPPCTVCPTVLLRVWISSLATVSRPTKQHLPREGPYYLRLVRSTRCEGLLSGNYGEVNL